jgi:putative sigma-54 modulation protein
MKIEITGRQLDLPATLKKFVADKLRKLERWLDGPATVHVVLSGEKHRLRAEITAKTRSRSLSGEAETDDIRTAVAEAVDKLERRAVRHKEKLAARKRRVRRSRPSRGTTGPAAEGLPSDGQPPKGRLVQSERYRLKPLLPEDAVLELEGTGEDLLVFRNADTERLNVVYRRRDGRYGLVEPDF